MKSKIRVGAICDPSPSHVMTFAAIGRALLKRGFEFTIFQSPEAEPHARAEGVNFSVIPDGEAIHSARKAQLEELSPGHVLSVRRTNQSMVQSARFLCEGAPDVLRQAGIDLLLADQGEPGASIAADAVNIPFLTVCSALPLNRDDSIPPCFLPWRYSPSVWAHYRNRFGYGMRDLFIRPVFAALNHYRRKWGLTCYQTPDDSFSRLAQITQLTEEFDLPHRILPECFHYLGPYQNSVVRSSTFDWGRLDGRPLIYASLGTILSSYPGAIETIVKSCAGFDGQVVISLGGRGRVADYAHWSDEVLFVAYAPQKELLKRARLVITHAGLNTVMESLECGVPIVAMPIMFDQPGVAERIVHNRVGESLTIDRCKPATLEPLIKRVLNGPYRDRAQAFQRSMTRYRGSEAAADIVQEVLTTGRPVPRGRL